ncbi:MAG: outer membrane beta-barrel protein [Vitreimonas sp.]
MAARFGGVALGLLTVFTAAPAQAQPQGQPTEPQVQPGDGSYFRRDRNMSVKDRQRQRDDGLGWRMGSFRLKPEIAVAAGYNDNIAATETDEQEGMVYQGDVRLDLKSDWGRHELNAGLYVPTVNYVSAWTATDAVLHVDGRYDVDRGLSIIGGVLYGERHEPYSYLPDGVQLEEPIAYHDGRAHIGFVQTLNRVRLAARADYAVYDYEDGELTSGLPYETDDRDLTETGFSVRADYAMSELVSFFVTASSNDRDHKLDVPDVSVNEDSNGYEVLGGVNFDITRLMRGEVAVGYFSQSFDDPALNETTGAAAQALVEWYPDELVTITVGAQRRVENAPVEEVSTPGAATYVGNDLSVAADYEFRRNVILGLTTRYSLDEYDQIDREDHRLNAYATVDYEVNRNTLLTLRVGHETQESEGVDQGRNYDANFATIGVRLRR